MLIVIGERGNGMELPPQETLASRLELGAFTSGSSGRRLRGLGLEWDQSINLRPALPTEDATWDATDIVAADAMMQKVIDYAMCYATPYDSTLLVCCGRRVATCVDDLTGISPMDVTDLSNAEGILRAVYVPHPSGQCRWWNLRDNWMYAREQFVSWSLQYCTERTLQRGDKKESL